MNQSILEFTMWKLYLELVLAYLVGSAASEVAGEAGTQYAAIIDAGSSGSRIRVYKLVWPSGSPSCQVMPQVVETFKKKMKPGLDSVSGDLTELRSYLGELIDAAQQQVPAESVPITELYLMATAGLRVLDSDTQTSILESVREILSDPTVSLFSFDPNNARILSGEEESAFAWIALNYLKGILGTSGATFGLMEMGGGSAQIAFVPNDPILANKFPVRIAGQTYPLYTHSYLYYGTNYIEDRIDVDLANGNPTTTDIPHPCILRGDSRNETIDGREITFTGDGDSGSCAALIQPYVAEAPDRMCHPKPCAIGRTYQPEVEDKLFVAISGVYFYTAYELLAIDDEDRLEVQKMNEHVMEYCEKTVDEAVNDYQVPLEFASTDCFMGTYIPMLLSAYGFPMETRNIYAQGKINNASPNWTLGAVLNDLGQKCSR